MKDMEDKEDEQLPMASHREHYTLDFVEPRASLY